MFVMVVPINILFFILFLLQVTGIANQGKTVSVVVRGSNKLVLEEAERSIHDALCVIRCLVKKRYDQYITVFSIKMEKLFRLENDKVFVKKEKKERLFKNVRPMSRQCFIKFKG